MDKFGNMTIKDLKQLLKERDASVKGKKKDLIQRLVFYEENNNFLTFTAPGPQEEEAKALYMPEHNNFKDVNSASNLPNLDMNNIQNYLNRFDANIQKGQKLYHNDYLLNGRMALQTNIHYFSVQCRASMKKCVGPVNDHRKKICKFVYTFIDWKIIDVPRNDKFIERMNATLTSYYEEYFKPQILNKYLYRSYDMLTTKKQNVNDKFLFYFTLSYYEEYFKPQILNKYLYRSCDMLTTKK